MSMISGQCDELRDLALWLDDEFYDAEASKVRQAADLILELRDGLQQANAENAKLIVKLNAEHIVRQNVEIENDRLRKACAELAEFLTEAEWLQWPEMYEDLRKLGVEVDR
jgi:hypothetical protein